MSASIPGLSEHMLQEQTFTQVFLTESLLSPSLITEVRIQDTTMTSPIKIYDEYKGKNFILSAANPNMETNAQLDVSNVIYRMEARKPINRATEEYRLQATHNTLLTNQQVRINKMYPKMTPTAIVEDALRQAGSSSNNTESTDPIRDYVAKNVHPYEVIHDQANYALAGSNDPSLLHFMTYENLGTHYFRSIKTLTKAGTIANYVYEDKGQGILLEKTYNIISYEFPCEFDLLSDIMNGVTSPTASIGVNPVLAFFGSSLGKLGGNLTGSTFTNKGTEDHSATTRFEAAQQYRAARLALIRPDRISLRITVPFNPNLHAGRMINVKFPTNLAPFEFGTGDYLIVSMTHNLRLSGYGVTMCDCVARSVGDGVT